MVNFTFQWSIKLTKEKKNYIKRKQLQIQCNNLEREHNYYTNSLCMRSPKQKKMIRFTIKYKSFM